MDTATSVTAPARLHFGLLQPFGHLPDAPDLPAFGGAGVMIDGPDTTIRIESADTTAYLGALNSRPNSRMEDFARKGLAHYDGPAAPFRMTILAEPPAHSGLGSGTALAMGVGRALSEWHKTPMDASEIARRVGRGERSAIGVYGSQLGGLIVDAGQRPGKTLSDLAVAVPMPADWLVLLALLRSDALDWHGPRERAAFARLSADTDRVRRNLDRLSRTILLDLLPAARAADLDRFGEAVFEINTRVGDYFAPVQGGLYASPDIADVVSHFRSRGIRGAAQSSWGPAVFAVVHRSQVSAELEAFRGRFRDRWQPRACEISASGTRVE